MPGMSGIEFAQTLRERKFKQPIIGLSSIGDQVQGKDWFTDFSTKPITKSTLFNLILSHKIQRFHA